MRELVYVVVCKFPKAEPRNDRNLRKLGEQQINVTDITDHNRGMEWG